MSCKEFEPLLQGYLEGELSNEEREMVEKHIEDCKACRKELDELKRVVELVSSLEEAPVPRDFLQEVRAKVEERQAIWQRIRVIWARPLRLGHSFGILAITVVFLGFFVWMNVRELVTKHDDQLSREDKQRPVTIALDREETEEEIGEGYMYKDKTARFKDHDGSLEEGTVDTVRIAKSEEERFLDNSIALEKSGRKTGSEAAQEKEVFSRQSHRGRDEEAVTTTDVITDGKELTETQTEIQSRDVIAKDKGVKEEGGYTNDGYSNIVIANGKKATSPSVGKGILTAKEEDKEKDSQPGASADEDTAGESVLKERDELEDTAKLGAAADSGMGAAAKVAEKPIPKETRIYVPIENYTEDLKRVNEIIKREKGTVAYSAKDSRVKEDEKYQPIIVRVDEKYFNSLYKNLSTYNRKTQKNTAQFQKKLAVTSPQTITVIIVIEDSAK